MTTKIQQTPNQRSPNPVMTWKPNPQIGFTVWLLLAGLILLTRLPTTGMAQTSPPQTASPPPTTAETFSGTITEVKPSELSVRLKSGLVQRYAIQDVSTRAVSVAGKAYNIPADIEVAGELPMKLIERGMVVRFKARCTLDGKYQGLVQTAQLVNESQSNSDPDGSRTKQSDPMKVKFLERPTDSATLANVEVVGRVQSFAGNQLYLHVQSARWAPQGRINFAFAADAKLSLRDRSLERVVAGDTVRLGQALAFETGEKVIQRIRIRAAGKRESLTKSFHGKLENKFRHLSNQPSKPREVRSAHFVLQTDLSDRSATILLAKLETMYELVSGYFRRQPSRAIECYIVRDIENWPTELDEVGAKEIRKGSGLTFSQPLNGRTKTVVYACQDHAIAQHEAVHAFCIQTFGGLGPVWYAEGLAEMGQYWKPEVRAVNIDPILIGYLNNAPKNQLTKIVAEGQITGDSWQAYASRWAICHLLAHNPNYSARFKTLGVNLMTGQTDSFEAAYAKQVEQISFEYDLFLKNLGNGYRVDLCCWDWQAEAKELTAEGRLDCIVKAKAGWQATGLQAEAGQVYDFAGLGKWKIDPQTEMNADGDGVGQGTLVGVWLSDYQLSKPFELGTRGKFIAPQKGHLFVRCRDAWTNLEDNQGQVRLYLRKSKK